MSAIRFHTVVHRSVHTVLRLRIVVHGSDGSVVLTIYSCCRAVVGQLSAKRGADNEINASGVCAARDAVSGCPPCTGEGEMITSMLERVARSTAVTVMQIAGAKGAER